jgi:superoxide reductase
MTIINEVYKCPICGNIVEVLHSGGGELVCCGQPMNHRKENAEDAALEKHVPVIEKTETGYKVTVGEVLHPMEAAHYIEWIELLADGKVYRRNLAPGQQPIAEFCLEAESVSAREYCNQHGLWVK